MGLSSTGNTRGMNMMVLDPRSMSVMLKRDFDTFMTSSVIEKYI
jgi:hypothetical protein